MARATNDSSRMAAGVVSASSDVASTSGGTVTQSFTRRLIAAISQAAQGAPTMTTFIQRLVAAEVDFVPSVKRAGRVSRLSYGYDGQRISGSELGRDYTWNGIQRRLGVSYDPQRDGPVVEEMASKHTEALAEDRTPVKALAQLEERLLSQAEELHRAETERLAEEFARLRRESIFSLSSEFRRIKEEELESLGAAVAPMTRSMEEVRDQARETLAQLQRERQVLDKQLEKTSLAAARRVMDAATGATLATQKAFDEAANIVRRVEASAHRVRQESFAMAALAALIAALLASLITGVWMSQAVKGTLAEALQHVSVQSSDSRADSEAPPGPAGGANDLE